MANSITGQLQQYPLYNNMIDGFATAGSAAIAKIAEAQSYISSCLSSVAESQNISSYLPKSIANALPLAQRTVSTSIGNVSISGAIGLGSAFLLPLIGNGFNIVRRTVTAYRQSGKNQSIMFDKTHKVDTQERKTQLKDRAVALHAQAQTHMDKAASTGSGVTGKLKYLLTFLAPAAVLPQIAALTTVPFAPAAVALGGSAVLARYLANRFDASRERAAAQVSENQAREFDAETQETDRLITTRTTLAITETERDNLAKDKTELTALNTQQTEILRKKQRDLDVAENSLAALAIEQKKNIDECSELRTAKVACGISMTSLKRELADKENELKDFQEYSTVSKKYEQAAKDQIAAMTEAFKSSSQKLALAEEASNMINKQAETLRVENRTLKNQQKELMELLSQPKVVNVLNLTTTPGTLPLIGLPVPTGN